jgi:hypothetical protein
MDLGLKNLTDDQLLELLQEACHELGFRDAGVRRLAQDCIFEEAERLKLAKVAAKRSIEQARERYKEGLIVELAKDATETLEEMLETGEVQLFTPGEESELVVHAVHVLNSVKMVAEVGAWVAHYRNLAEQRNWMDEQKKQGVPRMGDILSGSFAVPQNPLRPKVNKGAFGGGGTPFGGKP